MDLPIPALLHPLLAELASGGPISGKAAFIGVFVLLLIWLLVLPSRLIGNEGTSVSCWRNPRAWAVAVVIGQIAVYLFFG